ncbi:MAG: ZrgA family zinc uptake protein [Pseudobdellovibrionaceae bacterium]
MKLIISLVILLNFVSADACDEHEHRHHEAHVHGAATLNVAFDQLQGKVEFKAASESVLGFEHDAKTAREKKKLSDTILKFEKEVSSLIQFDKSLECTFIKDKIDMVVEKTDCKNKDHHKNHGQHSDFIANYNVVCKKDVKGTALKLDFTQFKGLKDLDVTILVGDVQKSVEIKSKPLTVELK